MKIYRYTFKYCLNYCFLSLLILVTIGLTYTTAFLASRASEDVTLLEWFKLISSMAPYLTYFLLPYALIVGLSLRSMLLDSSVTGLYFGQRVIVYPII